MRPLRAKELASVIKGAVIKGSLETLAGGVSTDSRNIRPGEAFFALKGPRFDGHAFLKEIFAKGASIAVVEKDDGLRELPAEAAVIKTDDTLKALGSLAAHLRSIYRIPVVAVTGSAGKTTTKEMIASILSVSRKVLKTEGNRNNLIGLPLTLLGLDPSHEAAVLELGISEEGEMERLANICRPDVALITNIGRSHLQSLGSIEGVAREKGRLFELLPQHGVKIVNIDDPRVVKASKGPGETVTYSMSGKADVKVESWDSEGPFSGPSAVYEVRGKKLEARFASPGFTNVMNGAAAVAAALALGAPFEDMAAGLSAPLAVKGRMVVVRAGDVIVLDDTYNANPESMAAALKTLADARGRKVAVLGDMLELGNASEREHASIGALAAGLGVDSLVAIGEFSRSTAEAARAAGIENSFGFASKEEALKALRAVVSDGDTVLVKGSRGVALEEVVEFLKRMDTRRACG
ncbi:MAG: UDP-N-acetylmuramoyl-tripeptide--D-alanyl-D-alanine ligase [Candidatus Methylomirabilis sp.]|nr:UDP-N-acetylmuramoyl-tripeptide--D-alanyl-D-alanine ligase [Deltaproteobacteria bacterium]